MDAQKAAFLCGIAATALLAMSGASIAEPETEPVSASVSATTVSSSTTAAPKIVAIVSPVPSYMDKGTTMVPLRPIAEFLNMGIRSGGSAVTLSHFLGEGKGLKTARIRMGQRSVLVAEGNTGRNINLPLAPEVRMGNTFVPVRLFSDVFKVPVSFRVPDNAVVIRSQTAIGVLTPTLPPEYRGNDAAILTLTNRIGRALTLRLSGPQKLSLELGRNQSITRKLRPGTYTYSASSYGMKMRKGSRRFPAKRHTRWAWGRR